MSENAPRIPGVPRIPAMTQMASRAAHEAGLPPPPGLVFDEDRGEYVIDPALMADPPGTTGEAT